MSLPHSRCNWVEDSHLLLVGAKPIPETLKLLLKADVKIFINLTDDSWYKDQLPQDVEYIQLPIVSGRAPTKKSGLELFNSMKSYFEQGKRMYLHCNGGHGRAGTMASLFIGKIQGLDASEAIELVYKARNTRIDTSRNFIPVPETNTQVKFLVGQLGLKSGHQVPNRSDRSWLKKVRNERTV